MNNFVIKKLLKDLLHSFSSHQFRMAFGLFVLGHGPKELPSVEQQRIGQDLTSAFHIAIFLNISQNYR